MNEALFGPRPGSRIYWWPDRVGAAVDAVVVGAATALVAWHLHPALLVTSTITTGGDTASHYHAAWWMRHELLPRGRISGWVPGSYAGHPLFQLYFPLPFVLMAALSLATGLPVAFKLVTVAGLVGLPVAAYTGFRLLGLAWPTPALAAALTPAFLFHEANSMWGANVASTLAGEFTYSFATALLLVLAGTLYRGAVEGRWIVLNGALLAAVGLSHAYALLVAAALGAYLVLVHPAGRRALPRLLAVAALGFGLMAFWAVPLLAHAGFTTAYSIVWPIRGLAHVFPAMTWPMLAVLAAGIGVAGATAGRRSWRRRSRVADLAPDGGIDGLRANAGRNAGEEHAVHIPVRAEDVGARADGAGASAGLLDHRVGYLASLIPGSLLFYAVSWKLDVVDVRFLPFLQLAVVLLAAVPAAAGVRAAGRWAAAVRARGRRAAEGATDRPEVARAAGRPDAGRAAYRRAPARPTAVGTVATLLVAAAALAWAGTRVEFIDEWAAWNYGGFEATPGWPGFRAVNEAVARTAADPRVAYEHSTAHDEVGTVRAFESLPLFSGASTLEGVYMQSTISSPFVFYLQSEISEVPSCPLLPYHCARLDAARAAEHLRLFNATEVIARGERVRRALRDSTEFRTGDEVGPYRIFHVEGSDGEYVVPLEFEPLVLESDGWQADLFAWFKRPGSGDVPLVVASTLPAAAADGEAALSETRADTGATRWARVRELPDHIPRRPLPGGVEVSSELASEEIRITTSTPGHPLLVKVSYHPRWRVEGADGVMLASPSFMLVVPRERQVRLVYGSTGADDAGRAVTLVTLLVIVTLVPVRRRRRGDAGGRERGWGARRSREMPGPGLPGSDAAVMDRLFRWRRAWAPVVVAALLLGALGVRLAWTDPWAPHRQALELFQAGEYASAEPLFLASMEAAPSSAAAYYSDYYHALCAFRTGRWDETLGRFEEFLRDYPDGELVPEAHFRVAEAFQGLGRHDDAVARFLRVIEHSPTSRWAGFAAERLEAVSAGARR